MKQIEKAIFYKKNRSVSKILFFVFYFIVWAKKHCTHTNSTWKIFRECVYCSRSRDHNLCCEILYEMLKHNMCWLKRHERLSISISAFDPIECFNAWQPLFSLAFYVNRRVCYFIYMYGYSGVTGLFARIPTVACRIHANRVRLGQIIRAGLKHLHILITLGTVVLLCAWIEYMLCSLYSRRLSKPISAEKSIEQYIA